MQEPPADDGVKRLMLGDHQAFFEALENPPAPTEKLRAAFTHHQETHLAALDAAIARGLADAEAGHTTPAEDVFKRLEDKYRAMAEKSAN